MLVVMCSGCFVIVACCFVSLVGGVTSIVTLYGIVTIMMMMVMMRCYCCCYCFYYCIHYYYSLFKTILQFILHYCYCCCHHYLKTYAPPSHISFKQATMVSQWQMFIYSTCSSIMICLFSTTIVVVVVAIYFSPSCSFFMKIVIFYPFYYFQFYHNPLFTNSSLSQT